MSLPYARGGNAIDVSAIFDPITLEQTLSTSALLKRVDNKYLVNTGQFDFLFSKVKNSYRLLTIDNVSNFGYRSRYFDDSYTSYLEHHQGKRQRFKVRIREYLDSGEIFFELKLKGKRGQTEKFRVPCSTFDLQQLDDSSPFYRIACVWFTHNYRRSFPPTLRSNLDIYYSRFTLVSTGTQERVTVDSNIVFRDAATGNSLELSADVAIIETKSEKGTGQMDRVLKNSGYRKVSKCSKYCLGLALSSPDLKANRFYEVMRRIRKVGRLDALA